MSLVKYFYPKEEYPEVYMNARLMITVSTARQLQRRILFLGSDIENRIQRFPNQATDTQLLRTLLG